MTVTYIVKNGIYINLTNRCSNSCDFCIRKYGPGVYGSDSLWLEHEPSAFEVISDLERYDLSDFDEIVFCGYGEPTERMDVMLEVAAYIKSKSDISVRLNTNGHGNLINGKDVTASMTGLIDTVSVSLNCADSESYARICHPIFGTGAYEALLDFARLSVPCVKKVVLSVVDTTLPQEDIEKCGNIAKSIGAELRIRPFE